MSRGKQANKENRRAVVSLEEERSGKSCSSASKHCRAWPLLMAVERNQSPQRSAQRESEESCELCAGLTEGFVEKTDPDRLHAWGRHSESAYLALKSSWSSGPGPLDMVSS